MGKDILIIGCNGYVSAIETETGKELWRTKLREGFFGGSKGSDVSVLFENNKVFAGCSGRLYALDASDGHILWANDLEGLGYNEVAMAMQGIRTEFITRVEHHTTTNNTTS